MVEREHVDSAHIMPNVRYTGYVWFRHRLAEPTFTTIFGRRVHDFIAPINQDTQLGFGLDIENFLLQRHLIINARLTQAVEHEGVIQVMEVACGLSPHGRRFRQRCPQLRYLEADLPPMAACKAALLRDQGWLGPEHMVAAVDILAEDGEHSLVALFVGLDREHPLVVVTEGLVDYFQRPVIEAFWNRLAIELKRFPQGIYLAGLCPDLREHPHYRQIRWEVGIIGRLTWGGYPLHYRSATGIEAAFARCSFASTLVLNPQREGATLGLLQGCLPGLVWVIEGCTT